MSLSMSRRERFKQEEIANGKDKVQPEEWQRWCRLCAKDDVIGNVSVFCKSEAHAVDTALATAIGKYFWVNIKVNDEISKYLCVECHTLITQLISFTERVGRVQAMFCRLQNSGGSSDLHSVRLEYGLLDEDREHIIRTRQEEEIYEDIKIKMLQEQENDCEEEEEIDEFEEHLHDEPDNEEDELEEILHFQVEDPEMEHDESVEKISFEISREQKESEDKSKFDKILGDISDTELPEFDKDIDDSDLYKELKLKDECYENEENEADEDEEIEVDADLEREKRFRANEQEFEQEPPKKRRRGRPLKHPEFFPPDYEGADTEAPCTEAKYECGICAKKYKNPTSYRKHMYEAHKTKPDIPDFKCEKCDRLFPTERQLGLHRRVHMSLEDKLDIPCPFCDRKFTKMSIMRQHVNGVHHNRKPYICDECGHAMKTLAALNEHKLVHTNDCPFECEICQKRFKNKARLKVHMDTHQETAYVCTECGLKLNTRRTLKMHQLVHSDNKRYTCDFCGAAFKRSKALKNHLILHSGLRPYKCTFCDRTFSNGSNCRSHKKKTHPIELAAEEAEGKKSERISVPKLEELRTHKLVIENPRRVQRHAGGLSEHMRALLIAAEEREKRKAAEGVVDHPNIIASSTYTVTPREILNYDKSRSTEISKNEMAQQSVGGVNDAEIANSDGIDEDEEEETVIYEIIDEI